MTCKDCKHFDADNHPKIFGFMSRAGHCDKRVADGYDEYPMPDCDACDMFELPADYGHDMAKFNAYCETYNNAVKQCLEVHHDVSRLHTRLQKREYMRQLR